MDDAIKQYPNADVLVSFASLRSAYESTVEAMTYPQVSRTWPLQCTVVLVFAGSITLFDFITLAVFVTI